MPYLSRQGSAAKAVSSAIDSSSLHDHEGSCAGNLPDTSADAFQSVAPSLSDSLTQAEVFGKLQEQGQVFCDELPRGLELCGFVGIKKEWVQSERAPCSAPQGCCHVNHRQG